MKKLVLRQLTLKNPGVTSLIIVLAIGMILTTMVAGIAALSVREQRQASNTEQSSRAFQVAESGVKVAAQKLVEDPNYSVNDCPVLPGSDYAGLQLGQNSSITCVEARSVFQNQFEGHLDQDRSIMFLAGPDIPNATKTPAYFSLYWHDKNINGDLSNNEVPGNSPFYPMSSDYSHAAALEISFLYWKSGNLRPDKDSLKLATIFVLPGKKDMGYSRWSGPGQTGQNNTQTQCTPNNSVSKLSGIGDYACAFLKPNGDSKVNIQAIIRGIDGVFTNYNVAVTIQPRYRDTNFKIQLYDTDSKPIGNFTSNKAIIDVTAKSGDLYRRVKAEVPTRSSILDNVFSSVLYSGTDICKQLIVNAKDNSLVNYRCGSTWQGPGS